VRIYTVAKEKQAEVMTTPLGVEVRRCLNSKLFSMAYDEPARRWVEEIDRDSAEESERRKDSSIAEQINIARSAKNAAWIAAIAAMIAANHRNHRSAHFLPRMVTTALKGG
jgi:hypothetical protein